MEVGPFFGNFDHAAANTDGMLPVGWVNDAEHDPWIAPDIAKLQVAFDGVDQQVCSIGIDPRLCQVRRAIRHDSREEADNALAQELLKLSG